MATEPTREDLQAIGQALAEALRHNAELFAVFARTAGEAAQNVTRVLDMLDEGSGNPFTEIRRQLIAFATVHHKAPEKVVLTTAVRDRLARAAEHKIGGTIHPVPDRLLGFPVEIDDTLPPVPGFAIRPTSG